MKSSQNYLRSFMMHKIYCLISLICVLAVLSSTPAYAIKKCKDADGKWHYGDIAVRECENSKVTTLSEQGFIKEQKAAPKTKEELAFEEANRVEIEAEKQRQEEIEKEKTRILSVYETEDAIDRQRDNQLYSVDSNIAVHNTYLDSMLEIITYKKGRLPKIKNKTIKAQVEKEISDAQANHEAYSKEMVILKSQREQVIEKFAKEKKVYRELTQAQESSK